MVRINKPVNECARCPGTSTEGVTVSRNHITELILNCYSEEIKQTVCWNRQTCQQSKAKNIFVYR